jgi:hypothetical protein
VVGDVSIPEVLVLSSKKMQLQPLLCVLLLDAKNLKIQAGLASASLIYSRIYSLHLHLGKMPSLFNIMAA